MANNMQEAIFCFHIDDNEETRYVEHKHPVPTFLCQPNPYQQNSQQFYEAFLDIVSLVTAQHHDECMTKVNAACAGCGGSAKDALKSPINYLHLAEPTIIIQIMHVCGSQVCEAKVRKQTIDKQNKSVATAKEVEKGVFIKMHCDVCNKPDAKRCAGCGQVSYCSTKCQKEAWKAHKPNCMRRGLEAPRPNPDLPYKVI